MALEIRRVQGRKELRRFVLFPERLYRHNPYYVPALVFDELGTLDPSRNPAMEFCEAQLYMAYRDGRPVGRIAGIINHRANEQWDHKEVRFGWFDFEDDPEVSRALMDKVVEMGRQAGMESVVGPLGFTDFDPEGMLVDGFDQESTMPLIYNHPYYVRHMEALGFSKEKDWIERRFTIPEVLPDRYKRLCKIVMERNNVHMRDLTRKIIREEDYGHKIFNLINETYKDLYNFTILPEHLADKYLGFYLSVLDLRFLTIVENAEGECVGFGITMPSLARALRKSRGRFFPFGWWPLLKSLFIKHEEGAELLLVGVRPDYQNRGINGLLIADIFYKFSKAGIKWAESNAILEDNYKNQEQFKDFDFIQKKRRRSYKKAI